MDGRAVRGVRRFADRLRHRRMCVDRANQLFDGALEPQRQRGFGDQLRRARTDHVDAEDLVVLLLGDDLDEPFRLAGDARAAEHAELEAAGPDVVAALLRFRLGQADAADLRIAVRAGRDVVVVDRAELLTRDPLGERDPFRGRQVRELRVPRLLERDDVADR